MVIYFLRNEDSIFCTHNTETVAQSHAPAIIECCGCSGKEIYLPTAKIAPSLRKFLTPCVPVANRRVVGVVVPRTTPRVLFTKLGKLCVFYTVRPDDESRVAVFAVKYRFFLSFFCRKNATAKPLALPLLRLHGLRLLSAPI